MKFKLDSQQVRIRLTQDELITLKKGEVLPYQLNLKNQPIFRAELSAVNRLNYPYTCNIIKQKWVIKLHTSFLAEIEGNPKDGLVFTESDLTISIALDLK